MTATEEQNVRLVIEHFAAESKHDYDATLATLADDVVYRMIPSGMIMRGKQEVTRYYDACWGAFPDVTIEVQRLCAAGEPRHDRRDDPEAERGFDGDAAQVAGGEASGGGADVGTLGGVLAVCQVTPPSVVFKMLFPFEPVSPCIASVNAIA